MAADTIKPKLDTLPNEILQKIWPLSDNPYLPLTSRKLNMSLNNEHVRNDLYRKLATKHLLVLLVNKTPKEYMLYFKQEHITPGLFSINNGKLGHLCKDLPNARVEIIDFECGRDGRHRISYDEQITLAVPCGTQVPERVLDGDFYIKVDMVYTTACHRSGQEHGCGRSCALAKKG